MLAGMRSCFLLSCLLVFSVVAALPLQAQTNGVPPSVTSIGFGGNSVNGVRPGVTSLGPKVYGNSWPVSGNCCAFWSANPNLPLSSGRRHHRKDKDKDRDHGDSLVGVSEPVYIPYAVPYAPESDDDSPNADADYVHAAGLPNRDAATKRAVAVDSALQADAAEPVDAQPPTALVFKDGHQSDVLNYAIVGDTLFDLSAGRTRKILLADLDLPATRKANDDRGVDFQIPASAARQ